MLAIAGGKGGCGKTTTTLGLSVSIDEPTVAVDVDRDMPNLHAMAGVERTPTLEAGVDAAQPIPTHSEARLLPAPSQCLDDAAVARRLSEVRRETTAEVLVDCPGGAGPDVAAPLSIVDRVVLVTTPCAPALRDAAKTAAMARALGTAVDGVILSRTRTPPPGVPRLLDCPVLGTVPTVDEPRPPWNGLRAAYERIATALGETTSHASRRCVGDSQR